MRPAGLARHRAALAAVAARRLHGRARTTRARRSTRPQPFVYEPKEVADTANTAWWKQFNDPVLDQLIDEALANNLNVKVAAANVEQAAGVLTQTRSGLFPQVGYGGTGERARTTESGATPLLARLIPNPQTSYQALLTASWEIDLWGRIRRLSESARANLLATDEARRGVILSLVSSVATNYLTLRGLDEQLVIAKRTLGAYAESVRLYTAAVQVRPDVADDRSRRRNRNTRRRPCRSRRSSRRSRRPRMRCRCCSAAIPVRSRAASRSTTSRCRRCRRACRPTLLDAAPGPPAGGADADRGQRADRRRPRAVLPDDLAHRRVRRRRARSCRTCSPAPRACGATPASSSGRSSRSAP